MYSPSGISAALRSAHVFLPENDNCCFIVKTWMYYYPAVAAVSRLRTKPGCNSRPPCPVAGKTFTLR
jgi:hypothetical protein